MLERLNRAKWIGIVPMNFPFHGFIVYWNSTSPSPLKYSHSLNLKPHGFNGIPPSNPCFDPFPSFVAYNLRAYFLLYFIIKKEEKSKARISFLLVHLLFRQAFSCSSQTWKNVGRSISRKICGNVKFLGFPRLRSKSRKMVYWKKKKKEEREKEVFFFSFYR